MAKNPTNRELAEDITEVKSDIKDMKTQMTQLAVDVGIALDRGNSRDGQLTQKVIFNAVIKLIGVIGALVALLAGTGRLPQ